jgi:hypothetical protein
VYERECHYGRGYWKHLKLNLGMIWLWLTFSEEPEDRVFESHVNKSWTFVANKLVRFQTGAIGKGAEFNYQT